MLTVVVPAYNGGRELEECLAAITEGTRRPDELIVVDDASTDDSGPRAARRGARVITLAGQPRGPAHARNTGVAAATGDLIVFIDADVAVHADTLARLERRLRDDSTLVAVFGSYDDAPPAPDLVSQYKNLQHHWVHQHACRDAQTFWAGCGAIRREAFLAIGGYDIAFERPAIEDIELGLRLTDAGLRVELDREILCTHLKRWTLASLLQADIGGRAIPWCRQIARRGQAPHDLNLSNAARWSGALSWLALLALCAAPWYGPLWFVWLATLGAVIGLNRAFYRFLWQRGGGRLLALGMALHYAYYVYSTAIFVSIAAPALVVRRVREMTRAQP